MSRLLPQLKTGVKTKRSARKDTEGQEKELLLLPRKEDCKMSLAFKG